MKKIATLLLFAFVSATSFDALSAPATGKPANIRLGINKSGGFFSLFNHSKSHKNRHAYSRSHRFTRR